MGLRHIIFRGKTFIYKTDLGNGIAKHKAKEDDHFVRFKDKGTLYLILKTISPLMDKFGNKFYFVQETDVHTFNIKDGKILDSKLEAEFKQRLKLEEISKFKSLMKEVEEDVIKERAKEILNKLTVKTASDIEENQEEHDLIIETPSLKLGKTSQSQIENLTPHDTINETISLLLDGKVLSAILRSVSMNKWLVIGSILCGSALTIIAVTLLAIMFPDVWANFAT